MRNLLGGGLVVALVALCGVAQAGDVDDTVFLKGGGRIRGTIVEEEPTKGVRIKLPDGRTRTLKPAEVDHVQYAADAPAPAAAPAPAPEPAPALAPTASAPPPAPTYYAASPPAWGGAPAPESGRRMRSKGLFIAGVTVGGVGVLGVAGGLGLFAASRDSKSCPYIYTTTEYVAGSSTQVTHDESRPCDDKSLATISYAVMGVGGAALAFGVIGTILGARKRPTESASYVPSVSIGTTSATFRWAF
jgi:hypothetical protein